MDIDKLIEKKRSEAESKKNSAATPDEIPVRTVNDKGAFIIPIDQIEVREQARKTFKHLEELADTIRARTQLQPVIVTKLSTGKYLLIDGERRFRAIRDILREKTIRATLREALLDPLEIRLTQLIANKQRDDYDVLELAAELSALKEANHYTDKTLAGLIGVHPSWVTKQRALHHAPEAIKERIRRGTLSVTSFWNNKKLILEKKSRQVLVKVPITKTLELVKILQIICEENDHLETIKISKNAKKEELLTVISERASEVLSHLKNKKQ